MLKLFKKLFTKKKKVNTERIIHYGSCCEKDFDPIPKEKPNFNPPPQKPIPPKPQVLKEGFSFKTIDTSTTPSGVMQIDEKKKKK